MTKEDCIALLYRYAEYEGIGIPNLAGCKEAMKMAADLLSNPSVPSNLDEAAEEWVRPIMRIPDKAHEYLYTYLLDAFKKGAEWMAKQNKYNYNEFKK